MVLSKRADDAGIDAVDIVEIGIAKGLRRVGDRFEKGEAFMNVLLKGSLA